MSKEYRFVTNYFDEEYVNMVFKYYYFDRLVNLKKLL